MTWHLNGTYFENCNCEMVCPCTTSGLTATAAVDRCLLVLTFHIDEGNVEGIDVSDKTIIIIADTPPLMADGNWRVGVIMDKTASADQAEKLGAVFSAKLGGPMGTLAPLIGEMIGMETAQIDYKSDGRVHSVKAGDFIDIEIEDFTPPGSPSGDVSLVTGVLHPANSTLTMARSTHSNVDAFGLSGERAGKNGHSAPFSWAA